MEPTRQKKSVRGVEGILVAGLGQVAESLDTKSLQLVVEALEFFK